MPSTQYRIHSSSDGRASMANFAIFLNSSMRTSVGDAGFVIGAGVTLSFETM